MRRSKKLLEQRPEILPMSWRTVSLKTLRELVKPDPTGIWVCTECKNPIRRKAWLNPESSEIALCPACFFIWKKADVRADRLRDSRIKKAQVRTIIRTKHPIPAKQELIARVRARKRLEKANRKALRNREKAEIRRRAREKIKAAEVRKNLFIETYGQAEWDRRERNAENSRRAAVLARAAVARNREERLNKK